MATKKAAKKPAKKEYVCKRSFNSGDEMVRRGEILNLTPTEAKKFKAFIE